MSITRVMLMFALSMMESLALDEQLEVYQSEENLLPLLTKVVKTEK